MRERNKAKRQDESEGEKRIRLKEIERQEILRQKKVEK